MEVATDTLGILVHIHTAENIMKVSVAALHQGMPGKMTWLENPPPWLKPCLALCIALLR